MFIATPRWDTAGTLADHTSDGQTVTIYEASPGSLPNASNNGTSSRHVIPGPPYITYPPSTNGTYPGWNASSGSFHAAPGPSFSGCREKSRRCRALRIRPKPGASTESGENAKHSEYQQPGRVADHGNGTGSGNERLPARASNSYREANISRDF